MRTTIQNTPKMGSFGPSPRTRSVVNPTPQKTPDYIAEVFQNVYKNGHTHPDLNFFYLCPDPHLSSPIL